MCSFPLGVEGSRLRSVGNSGSARVVSHMSFRWRLRCRWLGQGMLHASENQDRVRLTSGDYVTS